MFKNLLLALLLLLPVALLSAEEFKCPKINQGDWAVVLVRGLNLDQGRELTKVDEFINLLRERNISPQDGWKPSATIIESDYLGTLGKALIYLNTQNSSKKQEDFNKFFAFLEDRVGLDLSQLLAILPKSVNLQNLNEGLANYIATKESAVVSETQAPAGGASAGPAAKSKTTRTSSTSLASTSVIVSPITSLSEALSRYTPTQDSDDYWKIFSKPASPILPD